MTLTDKDCEELAEIFISMVDQMPDNLVNRTIKSRIGASHSMMTAGIISSKEKWNDTLGRFIYWCKLKGIDEVVPPND